MPLVFAFFAFCIVIVLGAAKCKPLRNTGGAFVKRLIGTRSEVNER